MTYFTPIKPGSTRDGVIGLQLRQSDYDSLLPSTVLEEPYELSFIAVFDASTNDLIWHKSVETAFNAENWPEVLEKIEANRDGQTETYEGQPGTYMNNITLSDGSYTTWQVPSPLNNITEHAHYREEYKMYVVCGQQGSLEEDINTRLNDFIEKDLMWF